MNDQLLFDTLKKSLFPSMKQSQVDGVNAILKASIDAKWPISYVAYALATAYHETNKTMVPIKELGGVAYLTKMYDITGSRPEQAKQYGNTKPGDGPKYCGRGYVQLTWKCNYEKAEKVCNIPGLVDHPDEMLDVTNASKVLISGMTGGWFSGRANSKYLPDHGLATTDEFVACRHVINGQDRAADIAKYAMSFQSALATAKY